MTSGLFPLSQIAGNTGLIIDGDWVESKDQDPDGEVRLVQLADIGVGSFLDKSNRFMTAEKAVKLKCTYLEEGDILVARMPDPLGRACLFPGDQRKCVTVVDVCILRPDAAVADAAYVTHILNSDGVRRQLDKFIKGTTRQRISRTNLEQIRIPLPSLAEQRRIAAILDQADSLRAKRREALSQLDELQLAIFIEMFGDPVANPKGWPTKMLKELGRVKTGGTPPSSKEGMFNGDVPFVTPGDLASNQPVKRTVTEEGAAEAETVRAGAALVCCIGATIGKMDKAEARCAFNQQINAIEWDEEINDDFGFGALCFFKANIAAWGASTTLPILKKSSFEKISIPVPPIPLQNEFARRVAMVGEIRDGADQSRIEQDSLFASLQHRAFQGAL